MRVRADDAYQLLADGRAGPGLSIEGTLDYSAQSGRVPPRVFPDDLTVDNLDLSGAAISELPARLRAYDLNLSGTRIAGLPSDLSVTSRLDLAGCEELESLPAGLTVGTLNLRGCVNLKALPEGLDVWFLDLSGCWAFEGWPERATIHGGRLQLRGCTALRSLPSYVRRLSGLNVRDCPNLTHLPEDLVVTGWLDLAHSGLTTDESSLPESLAATQLRWAGINVDHRVAFHPEQLSVDEVLAERNSERRRVLIDRYGYGRFLTDARAKVLNSDTDPGGRRQLLRIELPGDEPLVALSCFCPSTQRQYIIRVPPETKTCHQAAAWIAGFDDPADYHPLIET